MSAALRSLWSRSFQVSHAESAAVSRRWILTGVVASTGVGEFLLAGGCVLLRLWTPVLRSTSFRAKPEQLSE